MSAALFFCLLFQSPNADLSIEERYRVAFVLLDVVALDRKGNLVTDLTRDEFDIEENGRKVEITYFDTLDFRNLEQPDLEDIPVEFQEQVKSSQIQQIIIAIDLFDVRIAPAKKMRDRLLSFVKGLNAQLDYRINVFNLANGSLTEGFTQDRERVTSAIEELHDRHVQMLRRRKGDYRDQGLSVAWDGEPAKRGRATPSRNALSSNNEFFDFEKALESCGTLYSRDTAGWNSCVDSTIEEFVERVTERTNAMIGQIENLTYAFEDVGGLKTMLFLSPGFGLDQLSSAASLGDLYRPPEVGFSPSSITQINPDNDFRRVMHACIKNRVIFHTFDIFYEDMAGQRINDPQFVRRTGTRAVKGAYRSFQGEITHGLASLAQESGGTFIQSAQLDGPMENVLRQNRFFYVIGYNSPSETRAGEFREIEVDVKRRRIKVRHRTGYFASTEVR